MPDKPLHRRRPLTFISLGIGLGVSALLLLLRLGPDLDLFYRLEGAALDAQFKLRGAIDPGSEIIIVAVDEKSLKEQGRWPWDRQKQAVLVRKLAEGKPAVIGVDLIYSESDPGDAALAESLDHAGNVVLAFPLHVRPGRPAAGSMTTTSGPTWLLRHRFMVVRQAHSTESLTPYTAHDADPPVQPLADEAAALGHVYFIPDRDGITRYEYTALRYGDEGDIYPSFALETARQYLGVPKDRMSLVLGEAVKLGDRSIPVDQKARLLINYPGQERTFRYVSAADVLAGRVSAEQFRQKIVLIGTTALGTYDQKATPFSANYPGIEKNAAVIENIIHGRFLSRSVWAGPMDVVMIVALGVGLGLCLPRIRAGRAAMIGLMLLVGYAGALYYIFAVHGIWLDLVYPSLTILLTFIGISVMRLMTEEVQAKEIRAMFSSYVSPAVVEELIRDPRKATVGGQHKELTMVFADLVGFTAFSETQTAEAAVAQLNEYLGAMTEVVFHWHGTVDKYVGDNIVAFWGAPLEQPDHAELGVKCALHMRKRLRELQEKWMAEGKPALECGIGINTGTVIVGNIGAEGKKLNYTMIGDQVNLAARVQELTRRYQCPIIITETTAERIKRLLTGEERADNRGRIGHIALRGLGTVQLRGRTHGVSVCALDSLSRQEESRIEEQPEWHLTGKAKTD